MLAQGKQKKGGSPRRGVPSTPLRLSAPLRKGYRASHFCLDDHLLIFGAPSKSPTFRCSSHPDHCFLFSIPPTFKNQPKSPNVIYYLISNQIQANSLPTTAQQPHPHHPRGALRVGWVKIHTLVSHTIQLHVTAEYIKRGEEAFCDLRSCVKTCSSRVSACSCRVPRIFEIPTIFPSGHAAASSSTLVGSC